MIWARQRQSTVKSRIVPDVWMIAIVVIALFGAALMISHIAPTGDNYEIYKYISSFKNTHGVYPGADDGFVHQVDPHYFDYTPWNDIVYRAIFLTDDRLAQIIFILYEVSMLAVGLMSLRWLALKNIIPSDVVVLSILFFLLNPLVYRMLEADDKVGFFMWPPVCAIAAELNILLGAAAVGIFGGWTGLGIAALPTLPGLARPDRRNVIALLAIASAIVITMLLMHGSDSIIALKNRAARELMVPFSDSIWRWLPDVWWPEGRYPLIIIFIGCISLLFWRKKITYIVAIVAVSSTYLIFSNNTVPSRLLFFAPLLMVCFLTKKGRTLYILGAFFGILIAHGLRRFTPEFNPDASVGVLLCNAVLIVPVANIVLMAIKQDISYSLLTDRLRRRKSMSNHI